MGLDASLLHLINGVWTNSRLDKLILALSDTGVGIPEEQLPLVFERFYRFDSVQTEGGAGLGLSIARQIAEAHGGTIEIRSKRLHLYPDLALKDSPLEPAGHWPK
ncbi:MAG TPA: sensor histidine kinase [Rubrobacter sp.]|nr:sensor histidine kinase [Rubrobacter sp.]